MQLATVPADLFNLRGQVCNLFQLCLVSRPYKHNTPESEESLTPRTESSQGPMTEIYRPPRVESFHEVTPISWSTTSAKPEKEKYMHHLNGRIFGLIYS